MRRPTEDAVQPSANRSFRLDIQGLRALAVLAVVVFHSSDLLPSGFLGVDVFFVISGFVITAMLEREWSATGRISFRSFYFRRFKRLTPALALMVVVVLLASAVFLAPFGAQQASGFTALGAMLLSANFVLQRVSGGYFDVDSRFNPFLHTWSLSVEEQIYLLLPVILLAGFVIGRRSRPRLVAAVVIAVVSMLSLAVTFVPLVGSLLPDTLGGFFGPVPRIWAFGVGALVALLPEHVIHRGVATTIAGGGLLVVLVGFVTAGGGDDLPGLLTALPVLGTAALIYGGRAQSNPVSRLFATRPLVALGDHSYAWYLWHWPFVVFASVLIPGEWWVPAIAALLALVPAYVSTRWVETPLRRRHVPGMAPKARMIGATMLPPIAAAAALVLGALNGYWSAPVIAMQQAVVPLHIANANQCGGDDLAHSPGGDPECTWNGAAGGPPIYLIGDSNAAHFSEPLIAIAEELDRPLETSISSGCPPLDVDLVHVQRGAGWAERCRAYADSTTAWLDTADPGLVVFSITSSYWGSNDFAVEVDGAATLDMRTKRAVFETALRQSTERFVDAGHRVLLIVPIPRFGWEPQTCGVAAVVAGSCGITVPLDEVQSSQHEVWAIVEGIALETGVSSWSSVPELCPDDLCAAISPDGTVMYRDSGHLSVPGSISLMPTLREAIRTAG